MLGKFITSNRLSQRLLSHQKVTGVTNLQGGCNLVNVIAIAPSMVGELWPQIKPLFDKVVAVSHNTLNTYVMRNRILDGSNILLAAIDDKEIIAIVTVNFYVNDNGMRVLEVPAISGDRIEEWAEQVIEVLLQLKKERTCDYIVGLGRAGWERYLKRYGFKPIMTVMAYEG